jgi:membrane associated rhomboid family serine protease
LPLRTGSGPRRSSRFVLSKRERLHSRCARHWPGLVVLGAYGTTLLLGLVPTPGVAWHGDAFGAIGSVLAGRRLHREPRRA